MTTTPAFSSLLIFNVSNVDPTREPPEYESQYCADASPESARRVSAVGFAIFSAPTATWDE